MQQCTQTTETQAGWASSCNWKEATSGLARAPVWATWLASGELAGRKKTQDDGSKVICRAHFLRPIYNSKFLSQQLKQVSADVFSTPTAEVLRTLTTGFLGVSEKFTAKLTIVSSQKKIKQKKSSNLNLFKGVFASHLMLLSSVNFLL